MSDNDSLLDQCQALMVAGTPPESFALQVGERTLTLKLTGWMGEQDRLDVAASIKKDRDRGEDSSDLAAQLPDPDDLQYFVAALDTGSDQDLSGIAPGDIMTLAAEDATALPGWLTGGAGARLDALVLRVGVAPRLLGLEAAVSMAEDRAWQIIPDMIAVRDLRFDFLIENPFDPDRRRVEVGARGTICLGRMADGGPAVALTVQVRAMNDPTLRRLTAVDAPDALAASMAGDLAATLPAEEDVEDEDDRAAAAFEATMRRGYESAREAEASLFNRVVIDGALALDETGRPREVALSGLMGHFGWGDATLGGEVRIVTARCHYDSEHGQFDLRLAVAGPRAEPTSLRRLPALSLFHDTLVFYDAAVEIRGTAETGQVEGEISATLGIAEELVFLRARCAASGLVFEGRWEHAPGAIDGEAADPDAPPMDATALGGWMKDRFGAPLDPTLDTIEVRVLDLRLDTGAGRLSLDLEGSLSLGTLGRDAVTAMIHAEIGAGEDGTLDARFEGVLLVAFDANTFMEFDLDVIREGGTSTLFAAYRERRESEGEAPPDHLLGLRTLATGLGIGDALPEQVSFAIPAAYLARSAGTTVMGFEIAGGITLGELTLPSGLELFRGALDDLSDVGIKVDMAYCSGDVLPPIVAERAGAHGFHAPDGAGLSLLVHALLGEQRFDFKSVSLDAEGKLDAPKDVPARPGTPTGAPAGDGTAPVRDTAGARWIDLDRSFGPIRLKRIGVSVDKGPDDIHVSALLDGALSVGGLTMSLDGLRVDSPLSTFAPTLSLDGLGIDYVAAGVAIGGALVHTEHGFAGELLVRAEAFSITVEAIYETVAGQPSMAAYGILNAAIGGPPCFFVTGLAAGFGYNRSFAKPPLARIASNPLIRPLIGDAHSGTDARGLAKALPAAPGSHFMAFGIAFDSFRMIESFALAVLQLGERVEIDLLGVSTLDLPVDGTGRPLVHCRLVWSASYTPRDGLIQLDAELTEDSYIFDTDCKPSGGIGFRAWLKETGEPAGGTGPQQGDFVLSIGGYHKDFRVRPHHPVPKEVTLNWKVNHHLTIKGSSYFALTGSTAMAGGVLEATYDSEIAVGHIHATFSAAADFLLSWSPLRYDAHIHVEVSATFTYEFLGTHHAHFHAAADLHVWGPDFSMRARVSVTVVGYEIAFTTAYHDTRREAVATPFHDFLNNLLPKEPIAVRALAGAYPARDAEGVLDLDPHSLQLAIETTIPVGEILFQGQRVFVADTEDPGRVADLGARPCGGQVWKSRLNVSVEGLNGLELADVLRGPVPAALWSRPPLLVIGTTVMVDPAGPNDPQSVPDVPLGLRLRVPAKDQKEAPQPPETSATDTLKRSAGATPDRDGGAPDTLKPDDRQALRDALSELVEGAAA